MSIRSIWFDFGGVLYLPKDSDVTIPELDEMIFTEIADRCGISPKSAVSVMNKLLPDFSRGKIDEDSFRKMFSKETSCEEVLKISKEEWDKLLVGPYASKIKRNDPVFKIVEELEDIDMNLVLLSNTIPPHARFFAKSGYYNGFDRILSYKSGAKKPDETIYQAALDKSRELPLMSDLQPSECVLIDDLDYCIKGAEEFGARGILYKTPEQLVSNLNSMGVIF